MSGGDEKPGSGSGILDPAWTGSNGEGNIICEVEINQLLNQTIDIWNNMEAHTKESSINTKLDQLKG
jgi:hypothetical protein